MAVAKMKKAVTKIKKRKTTTKMARERLDFAVVLADFLKRGGDAEAFCKIISRWRPEERAAMLRELRSVA